MGKTLQAVSLLAADAIDCGPRSEDEEKASDEDFARSKKKKPAARSSSKASGVDSEPIAEHEDETQRHGFALPRTTLIVLPSSALYQWNDEIARFWGEARDSKGQLLARPPKVLVYYGDRKKFTAETLQQHDVVLTTYPTLENDYRKQVDLSKVQCEFCSKKMLARTTPTSQQIFGFFKKVLGPLVRETVVSALESTTDQSIVRETGVWCVSGNVRKLDPSSKYRRCLGNVTEIRVERTFPR